MKTRRLELVRKSQTHLLTSFNLPSTSAHTHMLSCHYTVIRNYNGMKRKTTYTGGEVMAHADTTEGGYPAES